MSKFLIKLIIDNAVVLHKLLRVFMQLHFPFYKHGKFL